MSSVHYHQLSDLPEECKWICADQWAYAHLNSDTLAQWYPYRSLEGDGSRALPPVVGLDCDVFPVGSIAIDESCRVLFRKDPLGWCREDKLVTSWAMRIVELELKIVAQHPYERGDPPAVSPIWFNTPMLDAKEGKVEDPEMTAFDGPFAQPDKEKFMSRLRLVDMPTYDSKQRNLHRKGEAITRAELAMHISADVEAVLETGPLCIDGKNINFCDLILVDVRCVSKGSVQATLAIRYYSKGPLF